MLLNKLKVILIGLACLVLTAILISIHWKNELANRKRYVVDVSKRINDKVGPPSDVSIRSRNIFYNRVGKCGSRSLLQVVRKLSKINHFNVSSSTDFSEDHPEYPETQKEAYKISQLKPPTIHNRHIHFIDFARFGYEKPIYINMIRNPMDRFVSQYNYLKYGDEAVSIKRPQTNRIDINECVDKEVELCNSTTFTFYIGMYFCGMNPICEVRSSERVSLAKKHLDEEFTFVGMMEEFETTLMLLEKLLPEYFTGALQIWKLNQNSKKKTATKKLDVLTEESMHKIQTKIMADDFEVYNYAKKKFDRLKEKFGLMD